VWCGGEPWFDVVYLGEKAEAKDFMVNLIEPTSGDANFYVQVKSTKQGYSGKGASRKLKADVDKEDIEKLKKVPAPTFVVGIEIIGECGFIVAITQATTGAIWGIPTKHRINCHLIKSLWKEIDDYWNAKKMIATTSKFST
jgi:hypothetical protein